MDAEDAIKKYWPWAVGAVVGVLLISRYMGGAGQSSGDSSLAAFYQSQAAAAAANQANSAAMFQAQTQRDVAIANLDLEKTKVRAANETQYLAAQAQMALAIGQSAAGTVNALYQPTIAALNSAAYENAAALTAGATVAAAGMTAQAVATQTVGEALKGYGNVGASLATMPQRQGASLTAGFGDIGIGITG